MKTIFAAATAILAVIAISANAADLPARTYTKAPMMVAVYDWTGFYIGANGGYGEQRSRWSDVGGAGPGILTNLGGHEADGGTAGGQIGYLWQTGQWVWGLEAQGNWADFRGSNISIVVPAQTLRSRMDAFGLFTGQVGYAWNNTLLYVKGGAAVTDNRYRVNTTAGNALLATANSNDIRWGGTVGVGLEFGFTPNWSFGVEYNHLFVERRNYAFTTPAGAAFGTARISGDADIVTARINYKWGGPVVARY